MIINKIFAIAMLPFSILIILEATGVFELQLPFNEIAIGAILMITLQILNLIFAKVHNGKIRFITILTAVVFIAPAIAYFVSALLGNFLEGSLPLILGVMMFVEGLYALH